MLTQLWCVALSRWLKLKKQREGEATGERAAVKKSEERSGDEGANRRKEAMNEHAKRHHTCKARGTQQNQKRCPAGSTLTLAACAGRRRRQGRG